MKQNLALENQSESTRNRETWSRPPLLFASNIAQQYGESKVLNNISLEVAAGETLVILGESGCGKTTLLRILAGLQEPDNGELWMEGRAVRDIKIRDRGIVYLDQEAMLFDHLNVFENVAFALRLAKCPQNEVRRLVDELLKQIQLEEHANKKGWQISGGQKQRVAFARAILAKPKVLLLDEPFCSLDSVNRAAMQLLFRRLRMQYAITAIFVTHDVKEAVELGDRFAFMANGRLRVYPDRLSFMNDESTGIPREIAFWQRAKEEMK